MNAKESTSRTSTEKPGDGRSSVGSGQNSRAPLYGGAEDMGIDEPNSIEKPQVENDWNSTSMAVG